MALWAHTHARTIHGQRIRRAFSRQFTAAPPLPPSSLISPAATHLPAAPAGNRYERAAAKPRLEYHASAETKATPRTREHDEREVMRLLRKARTQRKTTPRYWSMCTSEWTVKAPAKQWPTELRGSILAYFEARDCRICHINIKTIIFSNHFVSVTISAPSACTAVHFLVMLTCLGFIPVITFVEQIGTMSTKFQRHQLWLIVAISRQLWTRGSPYTYTMPITSVPTKRK